MSIFIIIIRLQQSGFDYKSLKGLFHNKMKESYEISFSYMNAPIKSISN